MPLQMRILFEIFSQWITPISDDRDLAFRERNIRIGILSIVTLGIVSFVFTIAVTRERWGVISTPTLHIVCLTGFVLSGIAIKQERIILSGWLLVIFVLFGASMLVIISLQDIILPRIILSISSFMFPSLLASLIFPRSYILPISVISAIMLSFLLIVFPSPAKDMGIVGFDVVANGSLLMLSEAAILWRLRVEFDARLDALLQSVLDADSARKRAEEADRTKSQFLANMSHELRTPLNAIIGYDEAMLAGMAGEFTPQQRQLLGHIQHNSRRLLNLINDILDLSKIEAGSMEVYVSPMSPKTIIGNTVDSLQSLATEKNISLDVTFSEDFPEVIMGDTRKIEQVLVNLLSNAIKFTEDGGINVQGKSIDDSHWQFCVTDTGIGMSEEAIQGIFDPFTQVDGSTTRKYKGTGLGLSITKQLVEMMDGKVEVESTPNVGTTFTVLMPKVKLPQTGKLNEISSTV